MYAARIEDNAVTEVIVGSAVWATENFGGQWIDSAHKLGPGWTWDGETFTPPPEPIGEDHALG